YSSLSGVIIRWCCQFLVPFFVGFTDFWYHRVISVVPGAIVMLAGGRNFNVIAAICDVVMLAGSRDFGVIVAICRFLAFTDTLPL
ncbi:1017_t:CDS:2, partial [Dentiscutata heterogama]